MAEKTYDRYAKAVLSARVDDNGRDIRLRVDGLDWQIAEVGAALRHLTALPKPTKDGTGETKVPRTWAMVTQCSKLMEERGYGWNPDPVLNQWIYDEFTRRHQDSGPLKFDVNSLHRTPMPHQVAGAFVGAENKRFFFGDAPGSGKTMTALLAMAELDARGLNPFPAFVVAPASVVDPWMEELEETFPDWPATVYRGPKRKNLSSRYKVYVMSWDVLRADMKHERDELPPLLKFLVPRTLVLDESHALCNDKTKQSVAARKLARITEYAFPMSGTPITRDVGGFWSALSVLDIRSFPDQERYKDRYTDRFTTAYGQDQVEGLTSVNRQEFYTLLQGSMRSVTKAEVLPDLPPKRYSTRVVDIPPAHRAAYDEMAEDMIAHIPDTDEPLEAISTLAQLQRLSQLASSACDVEVTMELEEREDHPLFGQEVPRYHVTMREPSWKVTELLAVLDDMQGSPVVTFSPHTQLINIAGARAEKEGYKVGYIKGGQSSKQRTEVRRAFQAGELDLLCANTAAGGVGITLTAADTLVFLERPWSYVHSAQSEDRLHRRGQTAEVHIIDIVARDSIEQRVRAALRDKAQALSDLLRQPAIVRELLGGHP